MRKKNYKRKRGPVQSKKITVDGIKFASGLEAYMYKALKAAKIPAAYEGSTYTIFQGFDLNKTVYERCANGKGFIIETKGRANEAFPMRWKLFKHYAEHNLNSVLYKPQNQKECDETVRLILKHG